MFTLQVSSYFILAWHSIFVIKLTQQTPHVETMMLLGTLVDGYAEKKQTTVTDYLKSKQLLLFAFAQQCYSYVHLCHFTLLLLNFSGTEK